MFGGGLLVLKVVHAGGAFAASGKVSVGPGWSQVNRLGSRLAPTFVDLYNTGC